MYRRVSVLVVAGLTVDVGSRVYDHLHPDEAGVRSLYRALPSRLVSRAVGRLADASLPPGLRAPLFGLYGRFYGVDFGEMQGEPRDYASFNAFFTRSLREGTRPVAPAGLVSPVDGKVMACGPVSPDGLLPTVKDYRYSLTEFLGSEKDFDASKRDTKLYQIVLYLAPGDYHGFHAPDDFEIRERRHFAGLLLPGEMACIQVLPRAFLRLALMFQLLQWRLGCCGWHRNCLKPTSV